MKRILNGEHIPSEIIHWALQKYPPDRMQILGSTFRFGKYYIPIFSQKKWEESNLFGSIVASLKRRVEKLGIEGYYRLPHFRMYIYDRPYSFDPSKQYVEIDVSKAYMTTAFQEGLISEKLYQKLLNTENGKELFLIALGSLQQQVVDIEILPDGKILFFPKVRVGYIYNYIASRFVEKTKDIWGIARWVDAWLVEKGDENHIVKELQNRGFKAKTKGELFKVVAIQRRQDHFLTVWVIQKNGKKARWIYHWGYLPSVPFPIFKIENNQEFLNFVKQL